MLSDIVEILTNHGILTAFVIVILLSLPKLMPKVFDYIFKQLKGYLNEAAYRRAREKMKHNNFFNEAQYKINVEIPMIEFCPTKPVKQQLYRDLLIYKIEVMVETASTLISFDTRKWAADEWLMETASLMTGMITKFEEKCRSNGIPELAIDRFKMWDMNFVTSMRDSLENIANSQIYVDANMKNDTLLLMMHLLLSTMVADAERSVTQINGQLAGIEYKGQPLEG